MSKLIPVSVAIEIASEAVKIAEGEKNNREERPVQPEEMAKFFNVSPKTLLQRKDITSHPAPGGRVYYWSEVNRYIKSKT